MKYLAVINLLGFLSMGIDKYKAIYHRYRISERALLLITCLGGSLGSYVGMFIFHHKTKHIQFYLGIPLILMIQILFYCFYFKTKF